MCVPEERAGKDIISKLFVPLLLSCRGRLIPIGTINVKASPSSSVSTVQIQPHTHTHTRTHAPHFLQLPSIVSNTRVHPPMFVFVSMSVYAHVMSALSNVSSSHNRPTLTKPNHRGHHNIVIIIIIQQSMHNNYDPNQSIQLVP